MKGSGLPGDVRSGIEAALEERTGRTIGVTRTTPLSGGSINAAVRVDTDTGDAFFLKWNPSESGAMFAAEADGLSALAGTADETGSGLRIPEVVAVQASDPGWLLLEFVDRGRDDGAWEGRLGRGVAALHRPGGRVGWHCDNFIGSLTQANPGGEDGEGESSLGWPRFWAEARIGPQLRAARERGHFVGRRGRRLHELVERIPDVLDGALADGPCLLHGDLWGGNVFPDRDGRPVLVDPAVYRGHAEVDLAMSELFGFPGSFLPAYREARPVDPAYDAHRRDLYQLYYLLVHVNLFGSGYEPGCVRAAERVLSVV